jgi:hypothetical protein
MTVLDPRKIVLILLFYQTFIIINLQYTVQTTEPDYTLLATDANPDRKGYLIASKLMKEVREIYLSWKGILFSMFFFYGDEIPGPLVNIT